MKKKIYIYIYIYINIGSRKKTTLSSRQACFMISHSSGDFNDKNIHNHRLYTLRLHCWGKLELKLTLLKHTSDSQKTPSKLGTETTLHHSVTQNTGTLRN